MRTDASHPSLGVVHGMLRVCCGLRQLSLPTLVLMAQRFPPKARTNRQHTNELADAPESIVRAGGCQIKISVC